MFCPQDGATVEYLPLTHVVIIDQNPPDSPAQHYLKLNDNAIALST